MNRQVRLGVLLVSWVFFHESMGAGMQSVQSQLKFETGEFEKIKGPTEACQADVLDFSFEGDDSNVVLRLGQRFIFSHLEQTNFLEKGLKGCTYKLKNETKEKFVRQTITHDCPKKSDSQEKLQTLKMDGDKLEYEYQVLGQPKASFNCQFAKIKK